MKRDEVDPQYAGTVDTAISRTTRYFYLYESRFPKDALAKTFGGIGLHAANDAKKNFAPILGIGRIIIFDIEFGGPLLLRLVPLSAFQTD